MPLAVDPPTRGHHSAEKGRLKLQRHTAIRKEVKTFAQEMGLKKLPSDVDSWRHLYQEMGKFLAAQSFLTHAPPSVMELPPAAIHDSKTHLRERAICDERISLPLSAFEELDTVYSKLAAQFGTQEAMVEVKVNWRCTNVIWWATVVDDEDLARTYYAKLGYSVAETEGFISKARELGPAGGGLGLKAEGKHPPLTLENLSSIMAPDSKKQNFGHRKLHGFLGKNGMRPSPQFYESLGIRSQRTGSPQSGRICLQVLRRFLESQGRQQPGRAVVRSLRTDQGGAATHPR